MVSKLIGKDSEKYGLGYGLFSYIDIPTVHDNQSLRIELLDVALFPTKGENLFKTYEGIKGYVSIKLGYKYVFSETQTGFYLLPSAGYTRVIFTHANSDETTYGNGIAGALEGGYTLEVGQSGHSISLGTKYEYNRGNAEHTLQSVGLRLSYAFGMFRRRG